MTYRGVLVGEHVGVGGVVLCAKTIHDSFFTLSIILSCYCFCIKIKAISFLFLSSKLKLQYIFTVK